MKQSIITAIIAMLLFGATQTYAMGVEEGRKALFNAVFGKGNIPLVKQLIAKKVNVNAKDPISGDTALHQAVSWGNQEMAAVLIDAGAELNAQDIYGNTPLRAAVREGYRDLIAFLLSKGADINSKNKDGETVLHDIIVGGETVEEMVFLIKKGAKVNVQNVHGDTPLHSAVRTNPDFSLELVRRGADPFIKNKRGKTPLDSIRDEKFKEKLKEEWRLRGATIGESMVEKLKAGRDVDVPHEVIKREIIGK